ncbi:LacI family DNA-binding transcriptional regulator [Streptomyces sp. NPDC048248]|uniref:LacI family DNA-binding transcriptional regulator n=1 Tax=Streptomyces sp. NPDC048248 TaxID=3365523 RepID=UPI003714B75C
MRPSRSPATMPDVARRAGVSVSTVSRTLRGLPTVSPATRHRVEQAAKELSFSISRSASSLVTGRTGRVAVMVPTLQSWFMGAMLAGLSSVLRAADLDLLIYDVPSMTERAAFFERLPARRNADALLVASFDLSATERERLDELGMPVVFVSQQMAGRAGVRVDDVEGGRHGTQYLVNVGHRRIAFVQTDSGKGFSFSAQERVEGYRKVLAESGIPVDESLVFRGGTGRRAGADAVAHLLSAPQPPTAVFAESDEVAIGVLQALRTSRIQVPEAISVLGFDNHEMAELFDLSTVAQSPDEVGRAAGELVRSILENDEADDARQVVLPTRLILRGSTAPLAAPDTTPAGRPRKPKTTGRPLQAKNQGAASGRSTGAGREGTRG